MDDYILIRPTHQYSKQIAQYKQEFIDAGDSLDGTGFLRSVEDPDEYISLCERCENTDGVPNGLVPATQLLFVRTGDNRLVGMIQIRWRLNDYLEKFGGHVGY